MKTIDELLQEALDAEIKARDFYAEASKKAQSRMGHDFFKQLADFENNHYERVKKTIESRTSKSSLQIPQRMDVPSIKPEISGEVEPNKDEIVDVINIAIQAEKDAQARYKNIAELISEPEGKTIFNDLADEENKHMRLLEDQFYHMSNKGTIIWGE
jgi:rubrerythrin